jgi:hypothetical protein
MGTTGRLAILAPIVGWFLTAGAVTKPQLERYPTSDGTVAFLVTATNSTGASVRVYTDGRCKARVDGTPLTFQSVGGSGGAQDVQPGESWKELVRLIAGTTSPGGQRPKNPDPYHIVGNVRMPVQLTAGRHAIAFNCGDEWSEDLPFDWK